MWAKNIFRPHFLYILSGVLAEEQLHIVLDRADACNAEVLNENLCHIGAEESGQGGAKMDILNTQIQQDRKSTRQNSSHNTTARMPSSA